MINKGYTQLVVIGGATATGKSSLAIALAQAFNGVILSADSRQVYRAFDIGTAKPTLAQQAQVPHKLIDICNPTEPLTVATYQRLAQALIAQCHPQALPFLVGGTGLYIDAVVKGLRIPPVAPQIELRSQLSSLGQRYCYSLLQQVDAAAAAKIHPNDQVRTLRALEVFYVTGRPISQQQGETPPDYPILYLALDCPPDPLAQRIHQRTQAMVEAGFVSEVKRLQQRYGSDLPLMQTLGYAEVGAYVKGELSLPEAIALTVRHTCQFAKRQRTWFRKTQSIQWLDAGSPHLVEQATHHIQTFLAQSVRRQTTSQTASRKMSPNPAL